MTDPMQWTGPAPALSWNPQSGRLQIHQEKAFLRGELGGAEPWFLSPRSLEGRVEHRAQLRRGSPPRTVPQAVPEEVSSGRQALARHESVPEGSGNKAGSGQNERSVPGGVRGRANLRGWWSPPEKGRRGVRDQPFQWSVLQALRERGCDSAGGIREGHLRSAFGLDLGGGAGWEAFQRMAM